MRRRDEAYVLETRQLGESDLIVTLLTRENGRVRGVARSARRSRRRFGGALEPLTRVTAHWTGREGRDLQRLESLEPLRSYAAMQSDPIRQAACALLSEVAARVSHEGQPDPATFRLVGAVLDALEGALDPWVAVRYFEFWILRLHGVLGPLSLCDACGREFGERAARWARREGGILCSECMRRTPGGAIRLDDAARTFLEEAAARPPSDLRDRGAACRPGGAVEAHLRGSLERFLETRPRAYRSLGALRKGPGDPGGRR